MIQINLAYMVKEYLKPFYTNFGTGQHALLYEILGFPSAEEEAVCHDSDAADCHGAGSVDRVHVNSPGEEHTRSDGY